LIVRQIVFGIIPCISHEDALSSDAETMSMVHTTPDNPFCVASATRMSRTAGWVAFSARVVATARQRSRGVLAGGMAH
jgi:hypothetical protein